MMRSPYSSALQVSTVQMFDDLVDGGRDQLPVLRHDAQRSDAKGLERGNELGLYLLSPGTPFAR